MQISERVFSGEVPKLARRNLDGNYAVAAINCELTSGELRPIRTNRKLQDISTDTRSIFRFDNRFFAFNRDVDMHEHPGVNADTRLFYTGDGAPSQTDTGTDGAEVLLMGVPKPVTGPIIKTHTVVSQIIPDEQGVTGEESNTLPLYDSFYVTTFVNRFGEEGDKSEPSETITRRDGDRVTLRNLGSVSTPKLAEHGVVAMRIYRFSQAGGLRFIAEIPLSQATYTDEASESDVSAAGSFATEDFAPPPADGLGLHIMSNGIALMFSGRVVYVSESYQPNAWASQFTCNSRVVGISSFDNTAVILTEEYPELATIFDPGNINNAPIAEREPCVAKRSIVQGAQGVMYAAPSGLFYIGPGGTRMITQDTHDYEDWQALEPETFTAGYRDGQYIAFYGQRGAGGGWIFDMREPNGSVRRLTQWSGAVYVLDGTDQLCLVDPADQSDLDSYAERLETYQAALVEYQKSPGTNPNPGDPPEKPPGTLEVYQEGDDYVDKFYQSKTYGSGAPVSISSRRLLSREFNENLSPEARDDYEQFRRLRAVENNELIRRRADLGIAFGVRGGAVGQNGFGTAKYWNFGNGFVVPGASTFAGDALTRLPIPYSELENTETLCVFGDDALVHEEIIISNEPDRINFASRHRYWHFIIKGKTIIEQIDLASSISAMGDY